MVRLGKRTALMMMPLSTLAFQAFPAAAQGQSSALESTVSSKSGAAACATILQERDAFYSIPDTPTEVMESQFVPAKGSTPAHCLVEGYIAPAIGFGLKLPITGWNKKFLMIGCGGICGSYRDALVWCDDALTRGYACAGTDQGHGANLTVEPTAQDFRPGLWSLNNLQGKVDHGARAQSGSAIAAKAIAEKFYNAIAKYTYFEGCSDGGRSAMMMAQRYPNQFDGIIAIDPVMKWTRSLLEMEYNYTVNIRRDGSAIFQQADLETLHKAVLNECDKLDGLIDGVIGDPRACHFDPGTIECKTVGQTACLTKEQVIAARKLYQGMRTSSGKQIFYGVMYGSELSDYAGFTAHPSPRYREFYRYMLFQPDRPNWTQDQLDVDTDYKRVAVARSLNDVDNPDLRALKANGTKLILSQTWNDSGLPSPRSSVDYYEQVEKIMGGKAETQDFMRLFMRPGTAHCGSGPGPNQVDYLTALEDWVEQGKAPDMLIGYHADADKYAVPDGYYARAPKTGDPVTYSRPLYPYPLQYKYKGHGDPNDYHNFGPVDPGPVAEIKLNY